ncbi:hypothetical protein ACFWFQ_33900, partial [Nocardia salmonicida]|uniref:hypothetical protein n=1 Tax=Nocardia salmonicida TaxID=53431 RepID=UPI00366766B8
MIDTGSGRISPVAAILRATPAFRRTIERSALTTTEERVPVYNEPIQHPAEPEDVDVEGILKGVHRLRAGDSGEVPA